MPTRDGTERPLPSSYCPFCTVGLPVVQAHDTADPFSLHNLLPAGTIPVTVHDGQSPCPSASNSRAWHSLPVRDLSTRPEDALFRELAFLTASLFLRATCTLGASGRVIFIRVYLVPNDLPNVLGRLRCRPESVVKEARRHLHSLIPLIEQGDGLWDADEASLTTPQKLFLSSHVVCTAQLLLAYSGVHHYQQDNRTMAEIYTDMPSPVLTPPTSENTTFSHHIASGNVIWGLRSTLYPYQRHSVAVMVHKELSTSPVPDPLYITIPCMSGINCHIQPSTKIVLRERPMFSPSRAGILCEELGTGKTVMVLALVLATVNQLPDPEESLVDERLVMTPLAYRHFPSQQYAIARARAGLSSNGLIPNRRVPSLVELLVHHMRLSKAIMGRQAYADELEASHLWPLIRANTPFYHHYNAELAAQVLKRPHRRIAPDVCPRTVYLTAATLVVVPLTLLGQWKSEIDKHCYDCVRYLIVRPSMDLPTARTLASDYDLIIVSDTRFRKESKRNKIEKLYHLNHCSCPCLAGSRVPDCRCPGDPEVTPLLQIRWKRLVIDEGHISANMATTFNYFVRQLSIEHKWIVTGTPTSNILGLSLGRANDEQELDLRDDSVDFALDGVRSGSPMAMSPSQDNGCHIRIWGSYDSLNLRKLGTMIGDFLAVPQFHSDPKSFALHVSTPLCDRRGPRPGAIDVLSQVMQSVMIRHRIEDVEKDVALPPKRHEIIYLDLDEYAMKSYNAMQAGLAINAIDSERTGTDYLFHPSKAKELQTTINNSSQGLFWSSSDILYNVDQICNLAHEFMARAIERQVDPEELDFLRQALNHAAVAANDELWRGMQPHSEVPFKVSGLYPAVFEAWTRTGLDGDSRTVDLMHPERLISLRSVVRKQPLITREKLVEEGDLLDMNENLRMASKSIRHGANQVREMAKEVRGAIEALKKNAERMNASDDEEQFEDVPRPNQVATAEAAASPFRDSALLSSSPLSGIKVGSSLSTKLNYILSEVLRYSAKEKFLVFSNSLLTLSQVGEGLSLFEIKYLRYTNEDRYTLREQCITTFESSDLYRVLLMELKLGARGLNLISASRVIFCEPVWHPDVESQAVKRVHRIGQTRPVTVKTLVIRSTAEEAMISRRQYLRNSDKVPNMVTESGMRQYLEHPRFLTSASSDPPTLVLSLDYTPPSVHAQFNTWRVDVDSDMQAMCDLGGEVPARKRVRFEGTRESHTALQ